MATVKKRNGKMLLARCAIDFIHAMFSVKNQVDFTYHIRMKEVEEKKQIVEWNPSLIIARLARNQ